MPQSGRGGGRGGGEEAAVRPALRADRSTLRPPDTGSWCHRVTSAYRLSQVLLNPRVDYPHVTDVEAKI